MGSTPQGAGVQVLSRSHAYSASLALSRASRRHGDAPTGRQTAARARERPPEGVLPLCVSPFAKRRPRKARRKASQMETLGRTLSRRRLENLQERTGAAVPWSGPEERSLASPRGLLRPVRMGAPGLLRRLVARLAQRPRHRPGAAGERRAPEQYVRDTLASPLRVRLFEHEDGAARELREARASRASPRGSIPPSCLDPPSPSVSRRRPPGRLTTAQR